MHSRIFLIGFMGSGKTTLGKKLAKKLEYEFVDMDELIVATSGLSVPEIFSEHGEALFRKWESDVIREVIKKDHVVVATGGGAPCHHNNMQLMNRCGLTVYIKLPPEAIAERLLQSKSERPLIKGKAPGELRKYIEELLAERADFYLQSKLVVKGMNLGTKELWEALQSEFRT